ncbi:MAG: SusC/RagA family TonB-linked outer membrane protein, partial [Candidatus Limisoma sp.]
QFGYIVDYSAGNGFYNTQEELDANPLTYDGVRSPRLGDLIYKDLNGDGVINVKDQAPLEGTRSIPTYSYSLNLEAEYKGFDLSMFWQGTAGRKSYYGGVGIHEDYEQGVFSPIHERAWTAERYAAGEEISYPALSTGGALSLEQNDFLVSKNDYVRLKNLVFGYTLPQTITQKIGISSLRIFFSGENLLTFTNFKFKDFIDPEQSSVTEYPIYKTFNFGLNVNF